LHRDHLGSILAITNSSGTVVEKRHFDAWGSLTNFENQNSNQLPVSTSQMFLDRGYTGHEHLLSVGLIHMNGRLYEPMLHRFLQPDNFVQDPYNTQNYNRYGYCLNNPLKYNDPSGELLPIVAAVLIGTAVGMASYNLTALLTDIPFSAGGLLQTAVISAFSSAVTFGIGDAATAIKPFYTRMAYQAFAHGSFQGMMAGIQGGNFWSSFAAAVLSSVSGSFIQKFSVGINTDGTNCVTDFGIAINKPTAIVTVGAIMGGAGAALTGGNFWQGAVTGLIVSGLNHAVHEIGEASAKRKFDKEIDSVYKGKADSPAPETDATLEEMKNSLPTLKKLHPKTGYAQLQSSELFSVGPAEAKTFAYGTDNYKKANSVFYRSSFSSYRNLAHNMLHEFGHAVHYFNGDYYRYITSGNRTDIQRQNWKEQYAFKFAFNNGGRPYQNETWYLINK
jgi:RHS repeat-associated protein